MKKTQEEALENKEPIQKALDKINADRNAVREQIQDQRKAKDSLREVFYKKLLEFEKSFPGMERLTKQFRELEIVAAKEHSLAVGKKDHWI